MPNKSMRAMMLARGTYNTSFQFDPYKKLHKIMAKLEAKAMGREKQRITLDRLAKKYLSIIAKLAKLSQEEDPLHEYRNG